MSGDRTGRPGGARGWPERRVRHGCGGLGCAVCDPGRSRGAPRKGSPGSGWRACVVDAVRVAGQGCRPGALSGRPGRAAPTMPPGGIPARRLAPRPRRTHANRSPGILFAARPCSGPDHTRHNQGRRIHAAPGAPANRALHQVVRSYPRTWTTRSGSRRAAALSTRRFMLSGRRRTRSRTLSRACHVLAVRPYWKPNGHPGPCGRRSLCAAPCR